MLVDGDADMPLQNELRHTQQKLQDLEQRFQERETQPMAYAVLSSHEGKKLCSCPRRYWIYGVAFLVVLLIVIGVAMPLSRSGKSELTQSETSNGNPSPTIAAPTPSATPVST